MNAERIRRNSMSVDLELQTHNLNVLARAEPSKVLSLAEAVLQEAEQVEVIANQVGLVMLPMREPAQGTAFHLGEVLVASARLKLDGVEGYGACLGRDAKRALAIAVLDVALRSGIMTDRLQSFLEEQAAIQAEEDRVLLCRVEATRVEMETF